LQANEPRYAAAGRLRLQTGQFSIAAEYACRLPLFKFFPFFHHIDLTPPGVDLA
jgi:hypothetical protein